MSSKEDQIIDGNVVKETPSEDHSLWGSHSGRFEEGYSRMIDPLEIDNVGTCRLV